MCRLFGDPPPVAAEAEPTGLAGERDHKLIAAAARADPNKAPCSRFERQRSASSLGLALGLEPGHGTDGSCAFNRRVACPRGDVGSFFGLRRPTADRLDAALDAVLAARVALGGVVEVLVRDPLARPDRAW